MKPPSRMRFPDLDAGDTTAIIGVGNISSGYIKRLGFDDSVSAIINSSGSTFKKGGVNMHTLSKQVNSKSGIDLSSLGGYEEGRSAENISEYLEEQGISCTFIDASNGNIDHSTLLKRGFRVITANKIPLSNDMPIEEFDIFRQRNYGPETSVMAGQGIVGRVNNEYLSGNVISGIEGVFSGTMGFITSKLEEGLPLSEAIKLAIKRKKTEPNPMDDLDGNDVVKKMVILARYAGYDVNINDVIVNGLVPNEFRDILSGGIDDESLEEFIAKIRCELDDDVKKTIDEGKTEGLVPRFVGKLDSSGISVGLDMVPEDSDLGNLKGGLNAAIIKTSGSESDYTEIGEGAGVLDTVSGLRRDFSRVLRK